MLSHSYQLMTMVVLQITLAFAAVSTLALTTCADEKFSPNFAPVGLAWGGGEEASPM